MSRPMVDCHKVTPVTSAQCPRSATRPTSVGDELPESDMADRVSCSGRLGSPAYGTTEGTQPARSCGDQHGAQSTLYSVVLPSKCSLSASASARVSYRFQ